MENKPDNGGQGCPDHHFSIDGLDYLLFAIETSIVNDAPKFLPITSILISA